MTNQADINKPIYSTVVGRAPLVIRAVTTSSNTLMVGGSSAVSQKVETYVLLSALPEELRQRVELAVQALVTAM